MELVAVYIYSSVRTLNNRRGKKNHTFFFFSWWGLWLFVAYRASRGCRRPHCQTSVRSRRARTGRGTPPSSRSPSRVQPKSRKVFKDQKTWQNKTNNGLVLCFGYIVFSSHVHVHVHVHDRCCCCCCYYRIFWFVISHSCSWPIVTLVCRTLRIRHNKILLSLILPAVANLRKSQSVVTSNSGKCLLL